MRLDEGHSAAVAQQRLLSKERCQPAWVFPAILSSSAFFVGLLTLATFFDPSVRVLHPLQALIYVSIVYLAWRRSPFGFGAGFFIAIFWNYIFLVGARKDVWAFLTGQSAGIFMPLQLSGVISHFVLIAASLVGFWCLHPARKQWIAFGSSGILAISMLLLLIFTLRPQSVVLLRSSIGL